ncbi:MULTISPECIES: hypothetical protein [Salinibaculum]
MGLGATARVTPDHGESREDGRASYRRRARPDPPVSFTNGET